MGAFDYTTNGVTMPAHSCMTAWWGLGKGGHELTHNTPEYLQTFHKINNSYFMIDKYPKCNNKYIIQNKNEYYDE